MPCSIFPTFSQKHYQCRQDYRKCHSSVLYVFFALKRIMMKNLPTVKREILIFFYGAVDRYKEYTSGTPMAMSSAQLSVAPN